MEAAMANLTLSIPDPDLARARKVAAERGTTVNAMVREFIAKQINTITPDQQAAIDRMIARSNAWAGKAVSTKVTREETYQRDVSGPW
jgi:phosphatidylserine/phosphatidylglycerophosphate/cardiolipin synthase-like enzyme